MAFHRELSEVFQLTTAYQNGDTKAIRTARALQKWFSNSQEQLPQLLALDGNGAYLIKSLDQDGVRHGDLSQSRHAYLDASVNVDATMHGVFGDIVYAPNPTEFPFQRTREQMEHSIMEHIVQPMMFDEDGYLRANAPVLDDTEANSDDPKSLWFYGNWVDGGPWPGVQGRGVAAYAKVGFLAQLKQTIKSYLRKAKTFLTNGPTFNRDPSVTNTDIDSFVRTQ
jgi:hypothetical protein